MVRVFACLLLLAIAAFSGVSNAQTILFEEDWNSGVIDPNDWVVSSAGQLNNKIVVIHAEDGGGSDPNDMALMINGSSGWMETIKSVSTFSRNSGEGLVVEFTTWVEGGQGAPAQGYNGPFHDPAGAPGNPAGAGEIGPFSIELGADWNWPTHNWSENSSFVGDSSPLLTLSGSGQIDPNTYQSRFGHSHDKIGAFSDALRLRFTLGTTQGGMIEWFNNNLNDWVVEGDFRNGVTGLLQQGRSDLSDVILGFVPFGSDNPNSNADDATGIIRGGVFIDDIVVYALTPPEDADFDGDDLVTGKDFKIWQANLGLGGQVDNSNGDANGDGTVDGLDLPPWEGQYGGPPPTGSAAAAAVPEPTSAVLTLLGVLLIAGSRKNAA